jgi:hypothetical protein
MVDNAAEDTVRVVLAALLTIVVGLVVISSAMV